MLWSTTIAVRATHLLCSELIAGHKKLPAQSHNKEGAGDEDETQKAQYVRVAQAFSCARKGVSTGTCLSMALFVCQSTW